MKLNLNMKNNRKTFLSFIVWLLFIGSAHAQKENWVINEYTTINKLYGGFNTVITMPVDSFVASSLASARVGSVITQKISNVFLVETQAAFQINSKNIAGSFPAFEFITKFNDHWQIRGGVLVTPTTTVRPNPTTWQSQVETYAQSRIIGSKPGAAIRYSHNGNFLVSYAIHYQNQQWANHIRMDYKKLRIAGYYQQDQQYFAAIKFTNNKVDAVANYSSSQKEYSGSCFYYFTPRYCVFTDLNYRASTEKNEVLNFGVRSMFENSEKHIRGFFGLNYSVHDKTFGPQVFLSLL